MRRYKKLTEERFGQPYHLMSAFDVEDCFDTFNGYDKGAYNTTDYLDATPNNTKQSEQFHLPFSENILI